MTKDTYIRVRMSESNKSGLIALAEQLGYKNVSALVRDFKGLYDKLCDELDDKDGEILSLSEELERGRTQR